MAKRAPRGRPPTTPDDPRVAIDGERLLLALEAGAYGYKAAAAALRDVGVVVAHTAILRLVKGDTATVRKSVRDGLAKITLGDVAHSKWLGGEEEEFVLRVRGAIEPGPVWSMRFAGPGLFLKHRPDGDISIRGALKPSDLTRLRVLAGIIRAKGGYDPLEEEEVQSLAICLWHGTKGGEWWWRPKTGA